MISDRVLNWLVIMTTTMFIVGGISVTIGPPELSLQDAPKTRIANPSIVAVEGRRELGLEMCEKHGLIGEDRERFMRHLMSKPYYSALKGVN